MFRGGEFGRGDNSIFIGFLVLLRTVVVFAMVKWLLALIAVLVLTVSAYSFWHGTPSGGGSSCGSTDFSQSCNTALYATGVF